MSQNNTTNNTQSGNVVPGGPASTAVNEGYGHAYPTTIRRPVIDTTQSAKMSPQILVLLIIAGLKRNWKWALPLGLILGALAFGVLWYLFPIKYETRAMIQILSSKPFYIFDDKQQKEYQALVNTQFALIRSPLIIEKAMENPAMARMKYLIQEGKKDVVGWLGRNIGLRTEGKSEMISVSMEAEAPADAETIVNSVVAAYFDFYESQSQEWNTHLITQLNREFSRQQANARLLQDEIRAGSEEAAQQGGAAGKDGGLSGGFAQGESIQRDLYLAESKLESLKAELKMAREYLQEGPKNIPSTMIESAMREDPLLISLVRERESLLQKIESLKEKLPRPDDPVVLDLQNKVKQVEGKITARQSGMGTSKVDDIRRYLMAQMEQSAWEKEMAVRAQEIQVESLRQRYDQQRAATGNRTVKIIDVTFQQAQLARINSVLDQLQTRMVNLQTEMSAPAQIQLRRKASRPTEPKVAKRLPISLMGGTACFLFPFFLSVAIERMKPRLYHVSQIRNAMPNVLIGEIMEPPVAWVHGASFRKRLARYRESVHNWCTHLLLSDPFRTCRTLSVASVSGDDGKTFLAVQVAVAMAEMKSGPVLLIDGDMRVGRLHLLFGNEETGIGLADVLSFRNGFGEAVVLNEKEPNLHLLSAGHLDVSPYELLGDGRFRELLDTLETHYSLILVVVPPVSHAAESLVMAASTDSVLLCVRQGETVLAAMEDVYRKLVNTGSSVDGIVVKDIPYYQMAGKDGGFADKLEQIRLAHLLQYAD